MQESAYSDLRAAMQRANAQVIDAQDLLPGEQAFKFENGKSAFYEVACKWHLGSRTISRETDKWIVYQMPNKFLPMFFDEFEETEVRSIEDIIKYNEDHAEQCLPLGQ